MKKTKKNEKSIFAKNLILQRFDMGMSGEKFAEYLEIPYGTLRDIEAGISGERMSTKHKIAKKLNTTVERLESSTPAQDAGKNDLLAALVSILPTLNESQLECLHATANEMISATSLSTRAR